MKSIVLKLLLVIAMAFVMFVPARAGAFSFFGNACSSGESSKSSVCQETSNPKTGATNPLAGPNGLVQKAANLIAVIAGIAAVIMLIAGSFNFVTSGGDQEKVKRARTTVVNSLIGIVIIALAWVIVSFVIQHVVSS